MVIISMRENRNETKVSLWLNIKYKATIQKSHNFHHLIQFEEQALLWFLFSRLYLLRLWLWASTCNFVFNFYNLESGVREVERRERLFRVFENGHSVVIRWLFSGWSVVNWWLWKWFFVIIGYLCYWYWGVVCLGFLDHVESCCQVL